MDITITNRVMSESEDTLKQLYEEQLNREKCNLESEHDMRIRLHRMKDSALRQVVFPVLSALADRVLRSRNDSYGGDDDDGMDAQISNKIPPGISDMIVSLDSIERSRTYFLDLLMDDYDSKYCRSNQLNIDDWDLRYNYFDVVVRSLYYEDDDFHLFDEDWLVAPIYAKRFVKMSKKCLKDILKDSCASSTLFVTHSLCSSAKRELSFRHNRVRIRALKHESVK